MSENQFDSYLSGKKYVLLLLKRESVYAFFPFSAHAVETW